VELDTNIEPDTAVELDTNLELDTAVEERPLRAA